MCCTDCVTVLTDPLDVCRGDQCVSASEDGSVRFWDTRQNKETSKVEPHTHSDLERGRGKWIGALDITDDWMVRELRQ